MGRPVFSSVFAEQMDRYLEAKVSAGFKETSFYTFLRSFDSYCARENILEKALTKEEVQQWCRRREGEATTTHYTRVNSLRHFLIYLARKGFSVYVPRDAAFQPTGFTPHIYTTAEVERYFEAVDTFHSSYCKKDAIQYPVLFRILYCCGTRINETLGIRKCDVDLKEGIIKLSESKNDDERYIVLKDDLKALLQRFSDKCFYLLDEDGYIFTNRNGGRLDQKTVYERHRMFLKKAGIPYEGDGKGPRIHDWRHHMAVYSFKQMADSGMDMYVALPILSAYLGHKTIYATEHYIRLTMELFPYIEERFSEKIKKAFGEAAENEKY